MIQKSNEQTATASTCTAHKPHLWECLALALSEQTSLNRAGLLCSVFQ